MDNINLSLLMELDGLMYKRSMEEAMEFERKELGNGMLPHVIDEVITTLEQAKHNCGNKVFGHPYAEEMIEIYSAIIGMLKRQMRYPNMIAFDDLCVLVHYMHGIKDDYTRLYDEDTWEEVMIDLNELCLRDR